MSSKDKEATPAAETLAQEKGIDLAEVEPSGSSGNIVVDDVKTAAERLASADSEVEDYVMNPEVGASVAAVVVVVDGVEMTFASGEPKPLTLSQYRQVENVEAKGVKALVSVASLNDGEEV